MSKTVSYGRLPQATTDQSLTSVRTPLLNLRGFGTFLSSVWNLFEVWRPTGKMVAGKGRPLARDRLQLMEHEPNLVISMKSNRIVEGGVPLEIEIFKLEGTDE